MQRAARPVARPQGRRALVAALAAALLLASGFATAVHAESGPPLVWHVETPDGKVVDGRESDKPVNPASVVKLATSLRALDTLGADHRYETAFEVTREGGDLVVAGGADPDFHFENAVVVAYELEKKGVTRARDLYVGPTFWIGWERGTVGRETDPIRRRRDMGRRLVEAWSPKSWSADQRRSWEEVAGRYGWEAGKPPSIRIEGSVRAESAPPASIVLVHRSQPLIVALRRFNVFSNNDIERLDASVGKAAELSTWLQKRWGSDMSATSFSTSSGLNRNRMTPRQIVRLLRELRGWLASHNLTPADLMPVLGCGESTLPHLFRSLQASGEANGMIGKTGTLNLQDGGVSALAGYMPVGQGLVFFVAAPGAGHALWRARSTQEDWIRRVLLSRGSVTALACPGPLPTSDANAVLSSSPAQKT